MHRRHLLLAPMYIKMHLPKEWRPWWQMITIIQPFSHVHKNVFVGSYTQFLLRWTHCKLFRLLSHYRASALCWGLFFHRLTLQNAFKNSSKHSKSFVFPAYTIIISSQNFAIKWSNSYPSPNILIHNLRLVRLHTQLCIFLYMSVFGVWRFMNVFHHL